MMQCSVTGCTDKHLSRGWCSKHYERWRRRGTLAVTLRESGTGTIDNGYHRVRVNGRYVMAHVLIAESALGKALPEGAVVHHVNENRSDNRNANLVICQNQGYHRLIHRRTNAYNASGHADWRQCVHCGVHDDPANMSVSNHGAYHKKCAAAYQYAAHALQVVKQTAKAD